MEKKIMEAIKEHSNLDIDGFIKEGQQVLVATFIIAIKKQIKMGIKRFLKQIEGGIEA